uniref:SSD domain-containing protein n=1 Tax=Panagrellus redivivus TaxID=6233 RepID=A0A7E4UX87_PANRE
MDAAASSAASSSGSSVAGAAIAKNAPSSYPSSAAFTMVSSEASNDDQLSDSTQLSEEHLTLFMKFMDFCFRNLGYFLADHAKLVLTFVLIFTAITSLKIPFTKQEDDLKTGYTPKGARSHVEMAAYQSFYEKNGAEPIALAMFIEAKDGGSMARVDQLNEVVTLLDNVGNEFKIGDNATGLNFYEFCTDFCEFNEPLRHFRNGMVIQSSPGYELLLPEDLYDSRINLSFPFMSVLGRELDLSPLFFGVKKYDSDDAQRAAHRTTNIEHLPLILLQFRADKPVNATKEEVANWERQIVHYYHNKFVNDYIKVHVLGITFAGDEIVRNGMTLFPFISVGFLIMSTFSIITVFISAYYFDQWTVHKISLALTGCICPLLATSSALGTLFWFGFRFGTILAVTPFLVMAIGVDDAFLMIHSWQRICVEKRDLRRRAPGGIYGDSLRDRIAAMVVDVGPSVSITSVTNCLAFIVGIFSPTPEIVLFCAGNAVAIFFDYVYQFLLFTPIICIAGDFEIKSEPKREREIIANPAKQARIKALQNCLDRILRNYCRWAADGFTALLVTLILIVYWIVSVRSALSINPSITPNKLFLGNSPINEMNMLREKYILPNYTAVNVFVNNVGDLSLPHQQKRVRDLIGAYEALPECLGPRYTHFWMRDFDNFLQTAEEDEEVHEKTILNSTLLSRFTFTQKEMAPFLNWPEYKHWNGFIRFTPEGKMDKFFAVIGFHGPELVSWTKRGELLNKWRGIADSFPDLEAWIFDDDSQFLDQIETLIPVTVQSSIATLICMALVCTVFMYNLFTVVVATLSIMSVCIGVFGFLAMWNIDLDPISMATTIMSIGFSVDFPAHASFHYYRCGIESGGKWSAEERIYHVISSIGFPLLQCGISTIFFVFCLLFIPSYMSEVFVKTMVLVITFGLIHGLFVIPVALCSLSRIHDFFFAPRKPISDAIKKLRKTSSFKEMLSVNKVNPAEAKNVSKITVPGL